MSPRPRRRGRLVIPFACIAPLVASGCGKQDVLDPQSHAQRQITTLWWVMLIGCSIGFGVIVVLLFLGWARRNRQSLPFGGGERAATALVIGFGVGVPILVLSSLLVWANLFVIR